MDICFCLLLVLSLTSIQTSYSQGVCNGFLSNALDESVIPNPSLENYSCCPQGWAQFGCAEDWINASDASPEYFNTCGFSSYGGLSGYVAPELALPHGGSGYAGIFDIGRNFKENAGNCLNSNLLAGSEYTMSLRVALSSGLDIFELALFGTPT